MSAITSRYRARLPSPFRNSLRTIAAPTSFDTRPIGMAAISQPTLSHGSIFAQSAKRWRAYSSHSEESGQPIMRARFFPSLCAVRSKHSTTCPGRWTARRRASDCVNHACLDDTSRRGGGLAPSHCAAAYHDVVRPRLPVRERARHPHAVANQMDVRQRNRSTSRTFAKTMRRGRLGCADRRGM